MVFFHTTPGGFKLFSQFRMLGNEFDIAGSFSEFQRVAGLTQRLAEAQAELANVSTAGYVESLRGTLGRQPL